MAYGNQITPQNLASHYIYFCTTCQLLCWLCKHVNPPVKKINDGSRRLSLPCLAISRSEVYEEIKFQLKDRDRKKYALLKNSQISYLSFHIPKVDMFKCKSRPIYYLFESYLPSDNPYKSNAVSILPPSRKFYFKTLAVMQQISTLSAQIHLKRSRKCNGFINDYL